MASAPSLSQETPGSIRVSVVRNGDGPEPWFAELDDRPDLSRRGATPEEAVQRLWAATNGLAQEEQPPAEATPQHSGKLLVRMPATLHDELAHAAEHEGVSLNQLITGILAGAVDWRSGDQPSEAVVGRDRLSRRTSSVLLVANLVLVIVAAAIAVALLVTAWI
jgi:predicted RNase H-like HicB family nuclease